MRCETAQRELSASMHESAPAPRGVREHAERCPACSRFTTELHRLHQLARIEPALSVPDLAPAIMQRVREERVAAPDPSPRRRSPWMPPFPRRAVAAGLALGLVVGFVLGAGGLLPQDGNGNSALATEIPQRLVGAAVDLRGYRATFAITERNWTPQVPVRTFLAHVSYRAPEDFRVSVEDTSAYPSASWPRNDLALVTNGSTWRATGANPCPPAELPACHPTAIDKAVVRRAPFDSQSPMPTDVIVPMTVLAAQDRVNVIGPDTVGGRHAVEITLSYQDAAPLFAYLQFLGSWRPFYPQDRVELWLDRSTWFPLRYEVFPARGPERERWASQFGIEGDRPGRPSFVSTIRSLSTSVPRESVFEPDVTQEPAIDEGFVDAPLASIPMTLRLQHPTGLRLSRYGRYTPTDARPFDESVAAYVRGLAWATVAWVPDWDRHRLFGVGEFPERVSLPGGDGVGYYEPATSTDPRRVALHTGDGEYLVASNLPRDRLLRIAAALDVQGWPEPYGWRVRRWSGGVVYGGLTAQDAIRRAEFPVLMPAVLPSGYHPVAAQFAETPQVRGVTIVFRRPAAELDGVGLRLYQAVGHSLPPPQSVSEQAVRVRGTAGRWSAENHLLEWVEGGVYRSLSGSAFELSTMLAVAESLAAPGG